MFQQSLADLGIKPADLIALGLPRSTAYGWCSGSSVPDHSAFVLALLQRANPNAGEQIADAKRRKAFSRKRG